MLRLSKPWTRVLWATLVVMAVFGLALLWRAYASDVKNQRLHAASEPNHELKFARGEYFIRFRDDHLHRIEEVLAAHDVELVFPITPNWALVVEKRYRNRREFFPFSHKDVPEYVAKANELFSDEAIVSASFNHDIRALSEGASDPYFPQQWNLHEAKPWQMGAGNVDRAWSITKGSSSVVIAPIEQGFMLSHPDIQASGACASRFLQGYDFRSFSRLLSFGEHGTNVLGVLAACSNNRLGVTGIDWNAKILPVVRGTTTAETLLSILWASGYDNCSPAHFKCREHNRLPRNLTHADVINLSFHVFPKSVMEQYRKYIARDFWLETISMVNQRNSILIAAAGNESEPLRRTLDMPAGADGVIAVGSIDRNGYSPSSSRFGPKVSVLAAGEQILTTATGAHKYASVRGTSFAAPTVAGVASLMKAVYPLLTWKSAEYFMRQSAGRLACDQYCGKKSEVKECKKLCCGDYASSVCPGPVDAFGAVSLAKACNDAGDDAVCASVGGGRYPKSTLVDASDYIVFADKLPFKKTIYLINHGAEDSEIEIITSQPGIRVRYPFDSIISRPVLPKAGRLALTIEVAATFPVTPAEASITFRALNGGDDIVTIVQIGKP